ncbi:MAG: hypothetical protein HZB70_03155 [Candidatus Berkelbacteria bacterium]|nr:MAG: hypothetical protein HZB70_03155 [Candidatus Berkelbacteria bacterium]QQG51701.1 MAG: hypothetical protein HY845_04035 [Candidatus Berkelbacteria bacterium]
MAVKARRHHKKSPSRHQAESPEYDLTFSAKDFPHHPKNHFWYIGIGLLAFALLAALYRSGEYLLMAVVVATVIAVFRLAPLEPQTRQVKFDHRGLTWGSEFYPYFRLRAFWIAETNTSAKIYIERLNLSSTLHFVVPDSRLDELVIFLADYLPWHHHRNEPISERLNRLMRF